LATDVCVPISRLAQCVSETADDIRGSGLIAPIVGHVGDGNFHAIPVFDAGNAEDVKAVQAFSERLVARALAMEGTCTGEHGIGQGKMAFLKAEAGAGVEVMRQIKGALDPAGILNPGKIFYS
jgi:D-lactate dehydrogenase (cytochrome)